MQNSDFERLLAAVRIAATNIAARYADEVDTQARFPKEVIEALRDLRLLSAGVPVAFDGFGCSLSQLAQICGVIAQGCSASGMVLAMHYIQAACLIRHGVDSPYFADVIHRISSEQTLIASATSEVGTSGETRSSICALEREGDQFRLEKAATTISYGQQADAILATARRAPDAAASDQVLVYLERANFTLDQTTSWDTLGMRGTCSPGGLLKTRGSVEQILPGSFALSSAQTMVPWSHILWAAVWWGIASAATSRASAFIRAAARRNPGVTPPAAGALVLATAELQSLNCHWLKSADAYDAIADDRESLMAMGWTLKMINQKIQASEAAPRIVHQALQVIGVAGYKNDSPYSVGRHYRDSLSAALMISNERLAHQSASMLSVLKDV